MKPLPRKQSSRHRFKKINRFIDEFQRTLPGRVPALLWLTLWRDEFEGVSRSAQTDLATRIGCSDRAIRDAIPLLHKRGLLKIKYQGGFHKGVSVYKVVLPRKPASSATEARFRCSKTERERPSAAASLGVGGSGRPDESADQETDTAAWFAANCFSPEPQPLYVAHTKAKRLLHLTSELASEFLRPHFAAALQRKLIYQWCEDSPQQTALYANVPPPSH